MLRPGFYIYNDVVVQRPDGSVEFYGYPEGVFPPTDFHSATLCGDEILIVGGLHYPKDRLQNTTLVYRLQLSDFSIQRVETQGTTPNWLHDHNAELDMSRQSLVCSSGKVTHTPTGRVIENLTTWGFDLSTNRWSATSSQSFHRWLLVREDESFNELWGIGQVFDAERSTETNDIAEQYKRKFAARGHVVDPKLHAARFTPPIPHTPVLATDPFGKDFRVHRLEIQGVTIRIREDMHEIAVTVEGDLPADILADLQQFGVKTYSAIEGVPYKSIPL
ncbi:hypothetical protein J7443_22025 [Tropicibacter sp. R15_0]|uniref:hypothetical protein n=1 Tax=Tropicibacter sp. R15_0 TaxID=2821101 RepID=UPI001ADBC9B3|nr:hypothetical protein [Tropicibacter sp. R15_0]MBO9467925.1 hypothetical protein [Tropicibacter sp. R15_0]